MDLETQLTQPDGLDGELVGLRQKAIEMARYYYKGMEAVLQEVIANAELYLEDPQQSELMEKSYEWINKIEDFYSKIPFKHLKGKQDFYPLFVIQRLLPKFRGTMDAVFKGKDKGQFRELVRNSQTIIDVGSLYWETLIQTCQEIRKFPEANNFRVAIPDRNKDYTWYF